MASDERFGGGEVRVLLVPGAWMGAWIWAETVAGLRAAGSDAETLTLAGVGDGTPPGTVRLDDHVEQVGALLEGPTVLVGHSYSGIVVGMVADRHPELVVGTIYLQAFVPQDGRSLLDDWSDDEDARAQERADIEQAGFVWAPPPAEGLGADPALTPAQQTWLGERFVDHPGRTALDPVTLERPVSERPTVFVDDLDAGHWPMVSAPDALQARLLQIVR